LDVIYTVYLDYEYNPGDIWRCDPNGNNLHVWATPDTGVIAVSGSKQVTLHAEIPLAAKPYNNVKFIVKGIQDASGNPYAPSLGGPYRQQVAAHANGDPYAQFHDTVTIVVTFHH